MPSGVKRVATILFGAGALVLCGCDQSQNEADRQVQADLSEARATLIAGGEGAAATALTKFSAAQSNSSASPAMRAAASAALAQAELEAAQANIEKIDRLEIELARHVWEITQLTLQVRTSNSAAVGYRQYDPKEARQAIAAKIAEAQGGNDKPAWFTHGSSTIPTLSAVKQDISRLEGEITRLQDQIKSVTDERTRLVNDAEQAAAQAEKLKGADALEVFKKSSDLRREAGSKTIELDKLQMELGRLQRSLGIAQGQQATLNEVIAQLQDQAASLDAAWKQVDQHIAAHQVLARQIMGGSGAVATSEDRMATVGAPIKVKAAAMDRLVKEIQTLRDETEPKIRDSIKYLDNAYTAADAARRDLQSRISDPANAQRPEQAAWKSMMQTLAPMQFKLRQANAQRVLAGFWQSAAASISNRLTLRNTMTAAVAGTDLTVPPEVQDGDLVKSKEQALTEAGAALDDAQKVLSDVIEVGGSDDDLIAQARLSRAITYYNLAQLERMVGGETAKKADEHIKAAIADRDAAAERVVNLPAMPVELGAPPKPVAPTPEPAPEATAAPAEASAEEQAVRQALVAFADAAEKGDVEAMRTLARIEPGQEAIFEGTTKFMIAFIKFRAAMNARFGEQSKEMLAALPDFTGHMRSGKITIKGDDAFVEGLTEEGQKKGDLVKADGAWKVYIEAPETDEEKKQAAAVPAMATALDQITADVEAGKYGTIQDVAQAVQQAMQSAMGG